MIPVGAGVLATGPGVNVGVGWVGGGVWVAGGGEFVGLTGVVTLKTTVASIMVAPINRGAGGVPT